MKGREQEEPLPEPAMFSFAECDWYLLYIIHFPQVNCGHSCLSNVQTCAHEIYTVDRQTHSEADTHSEWRSRGNTVYG